MSYQFTPLQLLWLVTLEKHPERQGKDILGSGSPEKYTACCLGQLLVCSYEIENKPISKLFNNSGLIEDNKFWTGTLTHSSSLFGLKSNVGSLGTEVLINGKIHNSLASMNDGGVTWPEIANYIRENPENVFEQ